MLDGDTGDGSKEYKGAEPNTVHSQVPISGSPLPYYPDLWNDGFTDDEFDQAILDYYKTGVLDFGTGGFIQYYTNCYADGFNLQRNTMTGQRYLYKGIQPGMISPNKSDCYYPGMSAENLINIIAADADAMGYYFEKVEPGDELVKSTWLVALVYGEDYHWYRQNSDGTWSHKPGITRVRNYDINGNIIYDPQYCEWGMLIQVLLVILWSDRKINKEN